MLAALTPVSKSPIQKKTVETARVNAHCCPDESKWRTTGHWTPFEDQYLLHAIEIHGKQWAKVCGHIPGRNGKQCRERFHNHLDPSLNRGPFTPAEDAIIKAEYNARGPKWSEIARLLRNRSDNHIKNRAYVTFLSKSQQKLEYGSANSTAATATSGTLITDMPTVQLDESIENVDFFSAMVEMGALPHLTQTVMWEPPPSGSLEALLLRESCADTKSKTITTPQNHGIRHISLDDLENLKKNHAPMPPSPPPKEFRARVCSDPGNGVAARPRLSMHILPTGREPKGQLFTMAHKCMAINDLINKPQALSDMFPWLWPPENFPLPTPVLVFNESVVVDASR
jgi:myb proto-oncogene protein